MRIRWVVLSLAVAGCSSAPKELSPSAFYSPTTQPVDDPQIVTIDTNKPPLYPQVTTKPVKTLGHLSISKEVLDVVQTPDIAARMGYAHGSSSGTYMTIGGVCSEVNGVPIFANKVLRALDPLLQARAKELDFVQYSEVAKTMIAKQVHEFEQAELEYAAADRSLDADDKKLMEMLTVAWRTKKINDAGGSVEIVKRRYEDDGKNFEEEVINQNHLYLTQMYYQKKIFPRVQVSVIDMRDYYRRNLDAMFTEHEEATFRLIKIDPHETDGKDKAIEKAKDAFDKARAGEDFVKLAAATNKDSLLIKNGGKFGPIQKGAFKLEKVEKAVFALQVGQVSDIIEESDGNFYIAKLEARKPGKVQSFEEQAVQDKIHMTLRAEQLRALREQVQQSLLKNAVIRDDPEMMNAALEMALQRYAAWKKA